MCFYHDEERAEISRETVRRARKAHQCSECSDGIAAGDRYLESTWLFDGQWGANRFCRRCEYDLRRIFLKEREEGCRWSERFPIVGELRYALRDAGWMRTPRDEVPQDFDFGWRVAAWAEETKAAVSAVPSKFTN